MINEKSDKSRGPAPRQGERGGLEDSAAGSANTGAYTSTSKARFPVHGYIGIAVVIIGEILLFSGNRFVSVYFTPIQWSGYILSIDAVIKKKRGWSLITRMPGEFALLAVISIGSWLIFEAYNLLLQNWRYVGLPAERLPRYIGYAWSFATISPGILLTYELVSVLWPGGRAVRESTDASSGRASGAPPGALHRQSSGAQRSISPGAQHSRSSGIQHSISSGAHRDTSSGLLHGDFSPARPAALTGISFAVLAAAGLAALMTPLVWPSPYMTPLVWIGFVLFLDPVNSRIGEHSIMAEVFTGHWRSLWQLFLSGLICGLLWEFWNYWAGAKWHYSVPYFGDIRLFEMPVLGFLGFMPFAVECFAIYKFIRRIIPIPIKERFLG
jgi:hypothetical protein